MSFLAIRKGERRPAWAAFSTLFALVASHSILETARDALFLAKVPATRLPWMFLAIAALSLVLLKGQERVTKDLRPERALALATLGVAGVTLAFYFLLPALGESGLYALYVWSGVLVTLVLVHFWALVSDLFTITQAKRLYGFIGAGSVLGAIAGSGAASLLARVLPPERLVVIAGAGFGVAALLPGLFSAKAPAGRPASAPQPLSGTLHLLLRDAYASRVTLTLLVASVCLTLADYVFKSKVAELVPKEELGAFLGTVYFGANLLSLASQVFLVSRVLRRTSLGAALAILPLLFVAAGTGIALTGSLASILALKATDGALRYSLHRTSAELLLVPFAEETRRRLKALVDVLAQRGGQVIASVAILAFTAAGAVTRVFALGLAELSVIWVVAAFALRKPYVELFRNRLRAGRAVHEGEFPELDVASLETLLATLESQNDAEVLAALHVLERENKAHLIPALILYHPSEQVVLRALEILTRSGRKNFVRIVDRVLDHPSPAIRAATIAARSVLEPDSETLRERLRVEASSEVRATIVVNLIAAGDFAPGERAVQLNEILESGSVVARVALAEAIGRRRADGFDDVLIALSQATELEVRRAAIRAMGHVGAASLLPFVVDALLDESTRDGAEQVLAANGADAFDALLRRLEDATTDAELRWRIPPALSLVNPEQTITALVARLPREQDGKVRFQLIRTLERLVRRHPSHPVDRAPLDRAVTETLARAYLYIDARLVLSRAAAKAPELKTRGHDLLCTLLRDKAKNARGRLFRLLGLLYPTDDFGNIYRGLGGGKELRASSMELIESILGEPLRSAVLGLADDGDDALRLARAGRYHRPLHRDYESVLALLAAGDSDSVRDVTRFHAAELGLEGLERTGRAA